MILSVITFTAVPIIYDIYEQEKFKQFFDVFDEDILFIQNQSMRGLNKVHITIEENYYYVKTEEGILYRREYPEQITYESGKSSRLSFNLLGSVHNPRTIQFRVNDGTRYELVLPFGKGRHYIVKKE